MTDQAAAIPSADPAATEIVTLDTILDAAAAELLGAFAAWCVRGELEFGISDARDSLYLETKLGTPVIVEAAPSVLVLSLPYPFEVATDAERGEAIEHLTTLIPVRPELAVLGDYDILANGSVGLRFFLPMPLTFSEVLVSDVIDLIDEHDKRAFGPDGVLPRTEADADRAA